MTKSRFGSELACPKKGSDVVEHSTSDRKRTQKDDAVPLCSRRVGLMAT